MKKLFLLFSHKLTPTQSKSAQATYGVEDFIYMPLELQSLWSKVPPDIEKIADYLVPLKNYLQKNAKKDDVVLIQGDFGASYHMVRFSKELGLTPIYATTKRRVKEYIQDELLVKESVFEFVRFREYE